MHSLLRGKIDNEPRSITGNSYLISPQIDSLCKVFERSTESRDLFVSFLREGEWIPSLIERATIQTFRSARDGFRNPEYILPNGSRLAVLDDGVNLYRNRSLSRSRANSTSHHLGATSRSISISRSLSASSALFGCYKRKNRCKTSIGQLPIEEIGDFY